MKSGLFALCASLATLAIAAPATANDRYLGEIIAVANSYCPRGSTEADGRLLAISDNTALFALLGTSYGGDGQSNFALPDLRGRYAVGQGEGPGMAKVNGGQKTTVRGARDADAGTATGYGLGVRYCIVFEGIFPSYN